MKRSPNKITRHLFQGEFGGKYPEELISDLKTQNFYFKLGSFDRHLSCGLVEHLT